MSGHPRLFTDAEEIFCEAIAIVAASNPFLPARIEAERRALGDSFVEAGEDWNTRPPSTELVHPNIVALMKGCEVLATRVRKAWPKTGQPSARDRRLYEEIFSFWLFHAYAPRFDAAIISTLEQGAQAASLEFYSAFKGDSERGLQMPGLDTLVRHPVPHLFACAFQIRRAFHNIYRFLIGSSKPMTRLRSEIWHSVFSHDLTRYRESLYTRLGDFSTLITGPSGSGKELVARAIGFSRYIPFEPKRGGLQGNFVAGFYPLNLAALSPTLIESELFGHRRGAFTGALADRKGYMEVCPATGAVFLDEIGEVEQAIQVKLLRVLQSRSFQALGSTEPQCFEGKIMAATNRDLPSEIRAGRFREDFYYRLCSDQLSTPSLRDQLDDSPGDLHQLVTHVVERFFEKSEALRFGAELSTWIEDKLGKNYPWPGNFRELEQCARSYLLRGEYRPTGKLAPSSADDWNQLISSGELSADELLRRYIRSVHSRTGNIEETARRLQVDRRTVKARL